MEIIKGNNDGPPLSSVTEQGEKLNQMLRDLPATEVTSATQDSTSFGNVSPHVTVESNKSENFTAAIRDAFSSMQLGPGDVFDFQNIFDNALLETPQEWITLSAKTDLITTSHQEVFFPIFRCDFEHDVAARFLESELEVSRNTACDLTKSEKTVLVSEELLPTWLLERISTIRNGLPECSIDLAIKPKRNGVLNAFEVGLLVNSKDHKTLSAHSNLHPILSIAHRETRRSHLADRAEKLLSDLQNAPNNTSNSKPLSPQQIKLEDTLIQKIKIDSVMQKIQSLVEEGEQNHALSRGKLGRDGSFKLGRVELGTFDVPHPGRSFGRLTLKSVFVASPIGMAAAAYYLSSSTILAVASGIAAVMPAAAGALVCGLIVRRVQQKFYKPLENSPHIQDLIDKIESAGFTCTLVHKISGFLTWRYSCGLEIGIKKAEK